jgi:hypothetical protein
MIIIITMRKNDNRLPVPLSPGRKHRRESKENKKIKKRARKSKNKTKVKAT